MTQNNVTDADKALGERIITMGVNFDSKSAPVMNAGRMVTRYREHAIEAERAKAQKLVEALEATIPYVGISHQKEKMELAERVQNAEVTASEKSVLIRSFDYILLEQKARMNKILKALAEWEGK